MKKIIAILGFTVLLAVFWASPASAQTPGTVTSDPTTIPLTEPGSIDVIFTGSDWGVAALYYAACPGALGDAASLTPATAPVSCPTVTTVIFASNLTAVDGAFTETITLDIRQEDIDAGAIVIGFGQAFDLTGDTAFRLTVPIGESVAVSTTEAPPTTEAATTTTLATTTTEAATTTTEAATTTTVVTTTTAGADDDGGGLGTSWIIIIIIGAVIIVLVLVLVGIKMRSRKS